MSKIISRRFLLAFISIAVLILSATILQSCYPGEELTYSDTDIVATFYNAETNFSQLMTYAILDSVIHIADSSVASGNVNRTYDQQILNRIEQNLQNLGFTEVADPATANAHVVALVNTNTWVAGGCYYGYWSWWYPYYGWCYPTYYTYTTGSLLIVMANPDQSGEDKGVWIAGINGLLSETGSGGTSSRINTNLQFFSMI